MYRTERLLLVAALLIASTACLEYEKKVYIFDLKNKTAELRFENIVSDSAEKADSDFMELVNDYVKGTKLETNNPQWRVSSKELLENDGQLNGIVKFSFDSLADAGIYQHDKKSPYIFCVNKGEIVSTNAKSIDHILKGCVALDRKGKTLEVTVKADDVSGDEQSLAPQYALWNASEARN
ncbi:MAG: hypothetical protein HN348_27405 [Proteobacteria bacterium]|jgi:hypothetical protein|nr:hypothetical protein [Pseudomonadota bacterium]